MMLKEMEELNEMHKKIKYFNRESESMKKSLN